MATVATAPVAVPASSGWFWQFLREEFQPYPHRVQLVLRMVIAATLIMLVCQAYRVPYGFQGAILVLFVARQNTKATLNSVLTMGVGLTAGTVFVIVSASIFTINPILHYIWVGCALFVTFFAISAVNSYVAVLMFSIGVTVGLPLWDRAVTTTVNVTDMLWLWWVGILGFGVAILVELAFARLAPGDNVIIAVTDRLSAVEGVLRSCAENGKPSPEAARDVNRYALLGTSLARRDSQRSGYNLPYVARTGAVISLAGTLVDTTAGLTQLAAHPSEDERRRARELADAIAQLREEFAAHKTPAPIRFDDSSTGIPGLPLLRELQGTVAMIPQVFAEPPAASPRPASGAPAPAPLLAHDAFTNPAHLQFGVKGAIAALLCYTLYTAIDWPGISTSVVTCAFTALTTVGASRQKQVLRILGAAAGGFVFGMGCQIFIFPNIDTIFGFTIVYMLVTVLAAWIMTASPRISYFGVQLALAFYLIHLQSYKFEASLSIARDRVVGVLVGLFAMWLIFDQLWGRPAAADMKATFIANLRLLAQLAREPDLGDRKDAVRRIYALGQTINGNFDQVRNLGDAVIFEFGPSRAENLSLRNRIRDSQSKLRALFLLRGAMLRYRLSDPGFELPAEMEPAQEEFDHELAETLDGMAEQMEGNPHPRSNRLADALQHLEDGAKKSAPDGSPSLNDFVALCRTIEQLLPQRGQQLQPVRS
jgi:multidrug resistance protein MdtO